MCAPPPPPPHQTILPAPLRGSLAHLPAAASQEELELFGIDEVSLLCQHGLLGSPGEKVTLGETVVLHVAR